MEGYYGDSAYTFMVGEGPAEVRRLLQVTQECLEDAVAEAVANNRIGDIGWAVQEHAEASGYGVVREDWSAMDWEPTSTSRRKSRTTAGPETGSSSKRGWSSPSSR